MAQPGIVNVNLLVIFVAYAAVGGIVFMYLEGNHEKQVILGAAKERKAFMELMDNVTSISGRKNENFMKLFRQRLGRYEKVLDNVYKSGMTPDADPQQRKWSLWGSLYYCFTVYTTIGYGNLFPSTFLGQAFTIIYGTIGIPLCLVVISHLGIIFNVGIKLALTAQNIQPSRDGVYPIPFLLGIIGAYMIVGGIVYSFWEGWGFFEGFYFCFVSLSTIGFGDVLPNDQKFFIITIAYQMFGLAAMAMLINTLVDIMQKKFPIESSLDKHE